MGCEPFRNHDAVEDDLALDEGIENLPWAHTRVEVVFAGFNPSFGILDLAEEPKPERADDEALLRKQTRDSLERGVGGDLYHVVNFHIQRREIEPPVAVPGDHPNQQNRSCEREEKFQPFAFRSTSEKA